MNTALLLPLFATIGCLVASRSQRRVTRSRRHRLRNDALLFGTGLVAVGLFAFEPNIGLVHRPVVSDPAGFVLQAALLWTGVFCAILAWFYHQ